MNGECCFECDASVNLVKHHVVPRSKGGSRTIFLCQICHDLVHGISPRDISLSTLTKSGLEKARKRGVKLGAVNPQKQVELMVVGARKAKEEFAAGILPIIHEIQSTGVATLQGVADCLNHKGILTRRRRRFSPTQVWAMLKLGPELKL